MHPKMLIERLEAECPLFKLVGGAVDFAAAKNSLRNKSPAAFVVPLAERARPNSSATLIVQQQIVQQFAIIIAVSNLKDNRGENALDELHEVREQVFSKLLGWAPLGTTSLMEFAEGVLLDMDDQVLWWQDTYLIDMHRRST